MNRPESHFSINVSPKMEDVNLVRNKKLLKTFLYDLELKILNQQRDDFLIDKQKNF